MAHRLLVALVATILTGLALALVAGHGPWAGPEIARIEGSHGVNVGDLPVMGCWLAGMVACAFLWRSKRD